MSLEYTKQDGTIGVETNANRLFIDEVDGICRSTRDCGSTYAWYNCKYIKTRLYRVFKGIRISRNISHNSLDPVYFKQHSGIGMSAASVKKYKKPTGEVFGIELEMVFDAGKELDGIRNKLLFSKYIGENFPEWVTERDGSLEDNCENSGKVDLITCNLELVSPPLSFESLKNALKKIIPVARELGAVCPDDYYGLHITANLATRKTIVPERFIRIVNENRELWEEQSGRKKSKQIKKYAPFFHFDDYGSVANIYDTGTHYFSTYPRNRSGTAIEVRIFKCEIDTDYLLEKISLVRKAVKFSKTQADVSNFTI